MAMDPRLSGAPAAAGKLPPHSRLWCRIRFHHEWQLLTTPDGEHYRRCAACGTDDDGTQNTRNSTGDGIAASNAAHWY